MLCTVWTSDDQHGDDGRHHVGHEALVAVADAEIAEAAAADRADHGREADQADDGERQAEHDRRAAPRAPAPCGRSAAASRPWRARPRPGPDRPRGSRLSIRRAMKGVGGDGQRHDGRRGADRGAGDQPREGDDRDDQDDEGRRARGVDERAEHAVDDRRREQLAALAGRQEDAERQAEQRAEPGRDRDHEQRVERRLRRSARMISGDMADHLRLEFEAVSAPSTAAMLRLARRHGDQQRCRRAGRRWRRCGPAGC